MAENLPDPVEDLNEEESNHSEKATEQAKSLYQTLRHMLHDRLSIKDLEDPEKSIEGIQKDVEFSGFNVWILIFSVWICSIGLYANSIAVVIGAMLISPLMGPIMGMGLSIGINDLTTLRKSLKSLAFAVIIAVLTSFVFFFLVPLGSDYSEILARTRPDIRDVFIAIFGGFAGILAGSRKEKTNVIPGVAIATALMPPLCTAGYGLASGHFEYFLGAFYLFIINTFFIALATILVVRYLKFPVVTFVSKARENKTRRIIILSTLVIIIPSVFVFYSVVKETYFNRNAKAFVEHHIKYEGSAISNISYEYKPDGISHINIVMAGEVIPDPVVHRWQEMLDEEVGNTELVVFQGGDAIKAVRAETEHLIELYSETHNTSLRKDLKISALEDELMEMKKGQLPESLPLEFQMQFPKLDAMSMGLMMHDNFDGSVDTMATFLLLWKTKDLDSAEYFFEESKISDLLKVRLNTENIQIVNRPQRN